ncbi:LuxR family transcriptional regulator [Infirmifilum lucidum]|uniref:LuxR family transcriptional regulator n=1 Tax=Infirmifilum lucidum TaxID=2776706 RepID=A0A7L9FGZ5_9CREN|nr:LuxR family transcriptional regulator [Infirmifilum lucidum]QOJ79029.1 LuxR family transcriptional regulator [Infirmifilum lucidum]
MKYLKVISRTCPRVPPDAYAHLGFRLQGGRVVHLVATSRGVEQVSLYCDECLFFRLSTCGYVYNVKVSRGLVTFVVAKNSAVRKLLRNTQVLRVEEVSHKDLLLTEKQRDALLQVAMGRKLGDLARELSVSKVAVHKLVKRALRKVALLI